MLYKMMFSLVFFAMHTTMVYAGFFNMDFSSLSGLSQMNKDLTKMVEMQKQLDELPIVLTDPNRSKMQENNNLPKDEEVASPLHACYIFNKENFNETLQLPEDIIAHIIYIDNVPRHLDFNFFIPSEYTTFQNDALSSLGCLDDLNDSKRVSFECKGYNTIEKVKFYMEDNSIYLYADYIQIASNSNTTLYRIKSKDMTFTKGVKTPCYLSEEPSVAVKNVKKGSKQERLLKSIDIKDVIISDIVYHKDLAIAIGEDNSPRTRELRSEDMYDKPVILRSTNNGKEWQKTGEEIEVLIDNLIMVDQKRIIISASMEGSGGSIWVSSDSGENWKRTYDDGMLESLKLIGEELIATQSTGGVLKSKDAGQSWEVIPQEEKSEEIINLLPVNEDHLPLLSLPQYKVDYETNTLIVQHLKNICDRNALNLSLTYNQSNIKRGILGSFWSLSMESHITVQSKDVLRYFDAFNGKEKRYLREKINKNHFSHKGQVIEQTKEGFIKTCNTSKHYFDKNGFLVKVEFEEKSYILQYQDNLVQEIIEVIEDKPSPYLSFAYNYEGVTVTFHHTKNKKEISFLKDTEGLVSSILEGNNYLFAYSYNGETLDEKRISEIYAMDQEHPYHTLLKFELDTEGGKIYDFREEQNGVIIEKNYKHYHRDKEHICAVNTLTKNLQDKVLDYVESKIDMYYFTYHDTNKTNIASTQFGSQTYGFDKLGRVDSYIDRDGNTSIQYDQFHNIENVIINKDGHTLNYSYTYKDGIDTLLKTIISPQGTTDISYNEEDLIKEFKINAYHLQFEYNKNEQPSKIIVVGKGEVITTYDNENEIDKVTHKSYSNTDSEHDIALDITQAMALLLKRISDAKFSIYPEWVW